MPHALDTPPGIRLRPYQVRAIEAVEQRLAGGVRHLVIVAPTGSGKTTIAAQLVLAAYRQGRRILFAAHRRELVNQAYARLRQFGIAADDLGVVMADDQRRRPDAPVQVATIATLRHRSRPPAELVIEDECHRVMAHTHRELAEHYADAVRIGLTATPYRADGQVLGDVYDDLVVVATPRELMRAGYLVEPTMVVPPRAPELCRVRLHGPDYDPRELAHVMEARELVGDVIEQWLTHAHDCRTLVFASSVAHSRHLTHRFRLAGVRAEHLDGTTPPMVRDAILGRLRAGDTQVVSGVAVLTEGFDEPSVKCAVLARPTKSLGLYLQQVGRALRPWRDAPAIILDHAGCLAEHGLPHAPRTFSLTPSRGAA